MVAFATSQHVKMLRRVASHHKLNVMNGGKGLWQQYVRNKAQQPAWEDLDIPMRTVLEALSDLKEAFYRHAESTTAHPKPTKAG